MTIRLFLIVFFSAGLISCASFPPTLPDAKDKRLTLESRHKTLSEIDHWDLKAAIALRSEKDAVTASLHWQQTAKSYQIQLFGPLGTGSFELKGQPGKVELAASSGKHFYAASPEALLTDQTGWNLPVSNLAYWIRGLPAPIGHFEPTYDRFNHLSRLIQDGWEIEFIRYVSVKNIDVPNKIFFHNANLKIKIVINQWDF